MRVVNGVFAVLALLLSACTLSLAQDLVPPPGSELSAETATPEPIERPESPPDLQNGAAIYAQSCAPCHGPEGLGDGDQADALPVAVPAIGDPELAGQRSPEQWFRIVSQGNLDSFMPPFASSLSVEERWDVLGYVYSLSGAGEGVFAAEIPELTQEVPATQESVEPAEGLTLSGSVRNGSGGELPVGSDVTLYVTNPQQDVSTLTTTLQEDGAFLFEGVPGDAGNLYYASIEYKGLIYFSDPLAPQDATAGDEFFLEVYEQTTDTSQLRVSVIHLVFEFAEAERVRVVQQVIISNLGDLAVKPADDGLALLQYDLPPEATNLDFESGVLGDRYELTGSGFGDYRAVLPGENTYQILFAFELPYSRGLDYERRVDLPTQDVLVFLPEGDIRLDSEQFILAGQQVIDGAPYSVYQSVQDFAVGDDIQISLSGAHPLGSPTLSVLQDDQFLIGLLALTLAVGAAWLWLRRQSRTDLGESPDALMDAIIELDQWREEGEIGETAYARQRERLKKRLRQALKKNDRDD